MSLEINGEIIDEEIIEHEFSKIKNEYQQDDSLKGIIPSDEELLVLVKENITRRTVLRQTSEKINLEVPEDFLREEIDKYKNQYPDESGWNETEFRNYLKTQYKINHILNDLVKDIEVPEERHIRIFFEDNKKSYFIKKAYDFIEIGVEINPKNYKILKTKIEKIKKSFSHGKDYQQEIKEVLGNTSYSKEWKVFFEEDLNHFIKEKIERLTIKTSTTIQEQENALYFLYLEKIYENYQPHFGEVKERVRRDLIYEIEERKIDIYVQKLIEKSEVIDTAYLI